MLTGDGAGGRFRQARRGRRRAGRSPSGRPPSCRGGSPTRRSHPIPPKRRSATNRASCRCRSQGILSLRFLRGGTAAAPAAQAASRSVPASQALSATAAPVSWPPTGPGGRGPSPAGPPVGPIATGWPVGVTAAWILVPEPPRGPGPARTGRRCRPLSFGAGRRGGGAYARTVHGQPFGVHVAQHGGDSLPVTVVAPAVVALPDAVGVAEAAGEIAPSDAGGEDMEDGVDEGAAAVRRIPDRCRRCRDGCACRRPARKNRLPCSPGPPAFSQHGLVDDPSSDHASAHFPRAGVTECASRAESSAPPAATSGCDRRQVLRGGQKTSTGLRASDATPAGVGLHRRGSTFGPDYLNVERCTIRKLSPGTPSEDVFRLAHYGLPEPAASNSTEGNPSRLALPNDGWFVWMALVGVGLLLGGVLVQRWARRKD